MSSQRGYQNKSTEQAYSDKLGSGKKSKSWEPRDVLYGKTPSIS